MKYQLIYTLAAMALVPLCANAKSHAASTEDIKAQLERMATVKIQNGGMVTRPAKGRLAIVTAPSLDSGADIGKAAQTLGGQLKFQIETVAGNVPCSPTNASQFMKDMKLNIAIFLVADESTPLSIVAMEERWAIINMSKLLNGATTAEVMNRRFFCELSRVAKALFVGANIALDGKAPETGSDLDTMPPSPIDAATLIAMVRGLPSYGLVASRTVPYRRACQEGWAPSPTNDYQKAVWEEVHAVPSDPMKIEFDPKKGR